MYRVFSIVFKYIFYFERFDIKYIFLRDHTIDIRSTWMKFTSLETVETLSWNSEGVLPFECT